MRRLRARSAALAAAAPSSCSKLPACIPLTRDVVYLVQQLLLAGPQLREVQLAGGGQRLAHLLLLPLLLLVLLLSPSAGAGSLATAGGIAVQHVHRAALALVLGLGAVVHREGLRGTWRGCECGGKGLGATSSNTTKESLKGRRPMRRAHAPLVDCHSL